MPRAFAVLCAVPPAAAGIFVAGLTASAGLGAQVAAGVVAAIVALVLVFGAVRAFYWLRAPAKILEEIKRTPSRVIGTKATAPLAELEALAKEGAQIREQMAENPFWDSSVSGHRQSEWQTRVDGLLIENWPAFRLVFGSDAGLEPLPQMTPMRETEAEIREMTLVSMSNRVTRLEDLRLREEFRRGKQVTQRTARWLQFKDLMLSAMLPIKQHRDEMQAAAPGPVGLVEPVDPEGADAVAGRIGQLYDRMRVVVTEALGEAKAAELLPTEADVPSGVHASPPLTALPLADSQLHGAEQAVVWLQDPTDCDLLPTFDPRDAKWSNYF